MLTAEPRSAKVRAAEVRIPRAVGARSPPGPSLSARVGIAIAPGSVLPGASQAGCAAARSGDALGRIRTCDAGLRRAALYPLSYEGPAGSCAPRPWYRSAPA